LEKYVRFPQIILKWLFKFFRTFEKFFRACLAKNYFSFKYSCQNKRNGVFALKPKKTFIKIFDKQTRPNLINLYQNGLLCSKALARIFTSYHAWYIGYG
jgi:hypothetical protein